MLKRAAFVAMTLAPALPGGAWAQATPDRAAALQQQIQDWLQSTLGPDIKVARDPVQVAAAGDHYDVMVPLGNAPAAPAMTGKMTDAGSGRWSVDDVRIPSPSVFHYHLPPTKTAGALTGEITSTLTLGEQQQRMLIDPTFTTPSTWTSAIKNMELATNGPGITQLSHMDSGRGASTITPSGDGRVDMALDSSLNGYTIKMSGEKAPQPVSIAMGKVSVVANLIGVSRERGLDLIHTLAKVNKTVMAAQTGAASPANGKAAPPPIDRETSMALLATLSDLATGLSLDEKVEDLTVTLPNMAGSLDQLAIGLDAKTDSGKLQTRMPLTAAGLTLSDIGLGSLAKLIPTKLSLTPNAASVPTVALMQMARKLADKQDPDDDDIAALFSQGPITAGVDDFHLDVAGSSFAGNLKVLASSPNVFSGTGQFTAENIDKLQQTMAADQQTAQFAPVLIFLKGIGRVEQNRLVWDIVYKDGHMLVNGQDMAALTGPPASTDAPPTRPRSQPQGASPNRPSQRQTPHRQ